MSKPPSPGSITSSRSRSNGSCERARQAFAALGRRFDHVALTPEPIAQGEHQPGFVFDDEDPRHVEQSERRLRTTLWMRRVVDG